MVEFRILGPLEVSSDGGPVQLGGGRQRAVLALLLLRLGQVVSTEQLLEDLWPGRAPPTATKVVQLYVSRLRKSLGDGLLLTRAPGYVLAIEEGQLDLHRFERLLDEGVEDRLAGRAEVAATKLRRALGLWRGPALADFAYEPFAQAAIVRLGELRLTAVEERIEADFALGRHVRLVAELETLVGEHPLRERLHGQLMLALYRSGRQADALAAYREARRALVEELGLEPTPALQALERAVLRQDPALDLAVAESAGTQSPPAAGAPVPERSILVAPLGDGGFEDLLALAGPLARRPPREVILAGLVGDPDALEEATRDVRERRAALASEGIDARGAAFVSGAPGEDVVRLASEQNVDLALLDTPAGDLVEGVPAGDVGAVLEHAPCDVGVLVTRPDAAYAPGAGRPVLVPFGGDEHDWTAAEIGAWIAGVLGAPLRLLGTSAEPARGRRDASRLLATASLLLQDVTGIDTEPMLVERGEQAVIDAAGEAGLLVVGLSPHWRRAGIGVTRLAVATRARPPTLLVRRGLRPGGLAPRESLTRFSWTLRR
jgi:DNA-binding SARP family transcriptional activator